MFRRIVHALCSPVGGYGRDRGMPYADIAPVRRAPVIHVESRRP